MEKFGKKPKLNDARGSNESIDDRDGFSHVIAPKSATKYDRNLSQRNGSKSSHIYFPHVVAPKSAIKYDSERCTEWCRSYWRAAFFTHGTHIYFPLFYAWGETVSGDSLTLQVSNCSGHIQPWSTLPPFLVPFLVMFLFPRN
jgi:hypothetical protein